MADEKRDDNLRVAAVSYLNGAMSIVDFMTKHAIGEYLRKQFPDATAEQIADAVEFTSE